ncbi:MAG: GNAT family N-acyltransferase [bacterium]|nr:GNAT family N-acyltransferase [bacterium]
MKHGNKMYSFKICENEVERIASRELRFEVFCVEKGWIDPSQFPNSQEFDEFDDYAKHIIALNEKGDVIGTARVIMPSAAGLPIEKLLLEDQLDPSETVEVSRLAVREDARGNESVVFFGVTRLMWKYVSTQPINYWAASVDVPLYNRLERLGMPFIEVAEPTFYVGSESVPFVADFHKTEDVLFGAFVNRVMSRMGGGQDDTLRSANSA